MENLQNVVVENYHEVVIDFETAYRSVMSNKKEEYGLRKIERDTIEETMRSKPTIYSLQNLYHSLTFMKDQVFCKRYQDELKWWIKTLRTKDGELDFAQVLQEIIIKSGV